jgi:hypothetical protein
MVYNKNNKFSYRWYKKSFEINKPTKSMIYLLICLINKNIIIRFFLKLNFLKKLLK